MLLYAITCKLGHDRFDCNMKVIRYNVKVVMCNVKACIVNVKFKGAM